MKHYPTTLLCRHKYHACTILALFLLALPSLVFAQILTISPQPTQGFVLSDDSLISCGIRSDGSDLASCSRTYGSITQVSLTATANFPYHFVGWSGACSGTSVKAEVSTDRNITCTAHFIKAPYTQVSLYNSHQCVVLQNGAVQCWDEGDNGQLGNGGSSDSSALVTVQGISTAIAVTVGFGHSCALLMDKKARCWGANGNAQLGIGPPRGGDFNTPQNVIEFSNAVAISAGSSHTCAVVESGQVLCWGRDAVSAGILGLGDTTVATTPTAVSGINNATAISLSSIYTCGLLSIGNAKCWGDNSNGQLGNGAIGSSSRIPIDVVNLSNAVAISAGNLHACALLRSGGAKCWGEGINGRLGTGSFNNSGTPTDVVNLSNAVAISAGSTHTCALLHNGSVQCWGRNHDGQLGSAGGDTATPRTVSGITTAITIAAANFGWNGACSILVDGNIYCWGTRIGETPTAVAGQPLILTPSAAVNLYDGHAFIAGSPYRAISNTLRGKPDWLLYSQSTGVFFGTPPAGSDSALTLSIIPDVAVLVQLPDIIIPINLRAVPARITIEDTSPTRNAVSTGLASGAMVGTVRLIAKDQTGDVPITWSLQPDNTHFAINADNGIITTKISVPVSGYIITVKAVFPPSAQRTLQPSISEVTDTYQLTINATAASDPLKLHLKIFLEGPLQ